VLDGLGKPEECLFECDVQVHIEVVANSSEDCMRLLLNDEDDITLDHVELLLAFLFESDFVAIPHTLLNVDCELLPLLDSPLAAA